MSARILVFQLPADKLSKLRFICMRLGVQVIAVDPAAYGQTLAALSGMADPTDAPAPEASFDGSMLVMADFTQQLANKLLSALKQARLYISLKAVMTPTNAQWNPVRLHQELTAERDAIARHMKHEHGDENDHA